METESAARSGFETTAMLLPEPSSGERRNVESPRRGSRAYVKCLGALALLVGVAACTSTVPVVYALSPNPTPAFPNGSLSSPVSEWVMVGRFPNIDACQNALPQVQTKVQRPVQCIPSDDPRLKILWFFPHKPLVGT